MFLYPEASGDRGRCLCFVTFRFFPARGSQRWPRGTPKSVQFTEAGSLPRLGTQGRAVGCPAAGPRLESPSSTSGRTGRVSQGPRRRCPSRSSHCKARKGQRGAGIARKGPSVLPRPSPRGGKTQGGERGLRRRGEEEKGGERKEGKEEPGHGRGEDGPDCAPAGAPGPRHAAAVRVGALSPAWAPGEGRSSRGRAEAEGRGRRGGETLRGGKQAGLV